MTVFNTPRPKSFDEMLQDKINLKKVRNSSRKEVLESIKLMEEGAETQAALEKLSAGEDEEIKLNAALEAKAAAKAAADKKKKLLLEINTEYIEDATKETFNQVIFEMCYNAFWLDDEVKKKTDVVSMYESYNKVKDLVSEVVPVGEDSIFVKNVKQVILEACKKKADKLTETIGDCDDCDVDEINFGFSDDENIDLDDNLNDLGKEEIESLVKNKVLQVVEDEKRASGQRQEEFNEIENKIKETENDIKLDASNDTDIEDMTAEEGYMVGDSTPLGKVLCRKAKKTLDKKVAQNSLFGAVMVHSNKCISDIIVTEGIKATFPNKAAAIFNDAIFTYTVMETLNTLGLYKFDRSNTKQLINKLQSFEN